MKKIYKYKVFKYFELGYYKLAQQVSQNRTCFLFWGWQSVSFNGSSSRLKSITLSAGMYENTRHKQ